MDISGTTEQVLKLSAAPPRRVGAILICTLGLLVLSSGLVRLWRAAPTSGVPFGLPLIVLLIALLLYVLARNLFAYEQLFLVKERSLLGDGRDLAICVDELVCVSELPPILFGDFAHGLAQLGLCGHKLAFDTDSGRIAFGIGLRADALEAQLRRIEKFTGRSYPRSYP